MLTVYDEEIDFTQPLKVISPKKPWKNLVLEDYTVKKLHVTVFKDGELVYEKPALKEIRAYVEQQLEHEVWDEEKRFENPHTHYVDFSPKMYE